MELNGIIFGQKYWYIDLGGELYFKEKDAGINASKAIIMNENKVITRDCS
ncbi:hypothetical protein PF0748 [Pyrococcus furiosus DSM 3638]|uniref:Uncharacterized protein n=1 Tax=Pyrococcus furiosus (strain ATCC 43587 / DSM 3638 / JCM 8422 / Vc1) TaxID=186497 RepID=Q8U2T2_PYRFU|nr:hypothetical protein PF0748 [Pyrococcus furiosus DSM 3638]